MKMTDVISIGLNVFRYGLQLKSSPVPTSRYDRRIQRLTEMQEGPPPGDLPAASPVSTRPTRVEDPGPGTGVSTEQTLAYQNREIGKDLLLFERHLQQGCRIAGTPCDCCTKHPMSIEALSEEALGMSNNPVYQEIIHFARRVAPHTTAEAAGNGEYDEAYPTYAQEARVLRKQLMGTDNISALLTTEQLEEVQENIRAATGEL